MAQKPLSEMADRGYENGSEEAGYVLYEWKTHAMATDDILDTKADKSELYDFVSYVDGKLQCRDEYVQTISALADKDFVAVEVILTESAERELIPQLKKAGASGIITYPLNKVIP